jgi:hypothetical protein
MNGQASGPGPQRHPHPLFQHRADASDVGITKTLTSKRPITATRQKRDIRTLDLRALPFGMLNLADL